MKYTSEQIDQLAKDKFGQESATAFTMAEIWKDGFKSAIEKTNAVGLLDALQQLLATNPRGVEKQITDYAKLQLEKAMNLKNKH